MIFINFDFDFINFIIFKIPKINFAHIQFIILIIFSPPQYSIQSTLICLYFIIIHRIEC